MVTSKRNLNKKVKNENEIEINEKTKQTLMSLLQQRDNIMAQFESIVCVVLDAKDVDYANKKIDFDFEKSIIKLS